MTVHDHVVRYQEHISDKSYEELVAAFESMVVDAPTVFEEDFQRAAESDNSREFWEETLKSRMGPSGFMAALSVDFGTVSGWYGTPGKAKMYIYGNPIVAASMLVHNIRVGGRVPLQILIYEGADGRARIGYDLPSSIVSRFRNVDIDAVAKQLDEKVSELITEVAGAEA